MDCCVCRGWWRRYPLPCVLRSCFPSSYSLGICLLSCCITYTCKMSKWKYDCQPFNSYQGIYKYTHTDTHTDTDTQSHMHTHTHTHKHTHTHTRLHTHNTYSHTHTHTRTRTHTHTYKCVHTYTQVLTVDSCQGSEFDYVVLSTVRANKGNQIGFVANKQRINVAISRSRYGLVVVGEIVCVCFSVCNVHTNVHCMHVLHEYVCTLPIAHPSLLTHLSNIFFPAHNTTGHSPTMCSDGNWNAVAKDCLKSSLGDWMPSCLPSQKESMMHQLQVTF